VTPAGSLVVEAPAGVIAGDPELVVRLLADIAEADGADRADWLVKASRAAAPSLSVAGDPRYQFTRDNVAYADRALRAVLDSLTRELSEILGGTDGRSGHH
jgi:hypothetical protein